MAVLPSHTAYRTVPRVINTVPSRLALLNFFQYRTVSVRYGTVRYGIIIAYRQSLRGIELTTQWRLQERGNWANAQSSRKKIPKDFLTRWVRLSSKSKISVSKVLPRRTFLSCAWKTGESSWRMSSAMDKSWGKIWCVSIDSCARVTAIGTDPGRTRRSVYGIGYRPFTAYSNTDRTIITSNARRGDSLDPRLSTMKSFSMIYISH